MEQNQFKNLADLLKAIEMKLTAIDKKLEFFYRWHTEDIWKNDDEFGCIEVGSIDNDFTGQGGGL